MVLSDNYILYAYKKITAVNEIVNPQSHFTTVVFSLKVIRALFLDYIKVANTRRIERPNFLYHFTALHSSNVTKWHCSKVFIKSFLISKTLFV